MDGGLRRGVTVAVWMLVMASCSSSFEELPTPTTAAVAAATTTEPATTQPTTTAPTATAPTATAPTTSAPRSATGVLTYFVQDERVVPVRRQAPEGSSELGVAIEALLVGPSEEERAAGYSTAVPAGVAFRSAYVNAGVAVVDLDRSFESGGGTLSMLLRLAQLTATAIAAPGVDAVVVRLDGEWVQVFSGEGIVLDHALTRADIEEQLPLIAPEQPAPGDEVMSPIRITGSANAFEATFQVQVVAADGTYLADFMTMATSGTGTRGEFDVVAPIGGHTGPATVRLLEYSAKDGSEINVITIPVTVVGGAGVNVGP